MVDNQIIDLKTEPRRLIRRCEVTAILVLYGLPRYFFSRLHLRCICCNINICLRVLYMTLDFSMYRLLTGSILAHEMMHAWLRLNGLSSYHSPIDIICVLDMVKPRITNRMFDRLPQS